MHSRQACQNARETPHNTMKQFPFHNRKGFTLIETLFAILIFSAALISLMTIAGRGISATNTSREQIVAHYLAQEGLEVVRNVRDTNVLNGSAWDAGFSACTEAAPCQVVYGNPQIAAPTLVTPCPYSCQVGSVNSAFVDADTANLSPYTRFVYVVPGHTDENGAIDEYRVVAKASWSSKTIDRSIVLQTILKRW